MYVCSTKGVLISQLLVGFLLILCVRVNIGLKGPGYTTLISALILVYHWRENSNRFVKLVLIFSQQQQVSLTTRRPMLPPHTHN